MAEIKKLTDTEIATVLKSIEGWTLDQGKLHRTFQFTDFVTAFSFMTAAALVAERMQHHPEWFNVYHTVNVHLTTHDAGGISAFDVQLARAMNDLAQPLLPR